MQTTRFVRLGLVLIAVCLFGPVRLCGQQDDGSFLGALDLGLHGFVDARAGMRTQTDPYADETSLAEIRLQLDFEYMADFGTLRLRSDFLYDHVPSKDGVDLRDGSGWMDLREANATFYPLPFLDLKVGRQILTWGTGDLLFINDLFPKDWQSFFCGRDAEYLKAPSDAVFSSFFFDLANIDIAYTPQFDPDRFVSGDRLSYWNSMLGRRAGDDAVADPETPDEWLDDDEWALRVYRTLGSYELAAYAYRGYWKTPQGVNPATMRPTYPALGVYGASVRGGLGRGIMNVEIGYYDSEDDSDGSAPLVPNSESRALAGYERELMKDLSLGLQYYLEHMMDYADYERNLPEEMNARDEDRQVLTARLTRQALNQTLTLSLFAYYSPTDEDAYLRPLIKYRATDAWLLTLGGNVFMGEQPHTFFGQFEDNSNIYAGARYSF